jgi:carbamoyl-phosphate synthase large subunit
LDYVVTKIPRFAFEKFPGTKDSLSTQMKSVGEVMAIGRTFKESIQKAVLSLEHDPRGLSPVDFDEDKLSQPNSQRFLYVCQAFRNGLSVNDVARLTSITPWFLEQIEEIVKFEKTLAETEVDQKILKQAKQLGFSDAAIAYWQKTKPSEIFKKRTQWGLHPAFFQVDTCAGEFQSETPYFYSTYWSVPTEPRAKNLNSVLVMGSGPNRIGQGIEFDYSCVRSVNRFRREGCNVIMVNSNPETVSTDYDTANELFFEPLTAEHVGEVLRFVQPRGFVAQLGGQTPINLAPKLIDLGFEMLGSTLESVDLAEDRGRFNRICEEFKIEIPRSGLAANLNDAKEIVGRVHYPVLCRPSYVLGGRRMEIIENDQELQSYFERHANYISSTNLCLVDEFLERALEVDVDIVRGKDWAVVGGIVEHIEAAGVHSGDSMGVIPPQRLKPETGHKIEELALKLADRLGVIGFLNLQLAIKNDVIYMLEANPRSSRSVPFLVKATGIPLVDLGVLAILGKTRAEVKPERFQWRNIGSVAVKGVVFPFKKFFETDTILGPEMKSTGESMGRGQDFPEALLKAFISSHLSFPEDGEVFFSLREKDKPELLPLARELIEMGYRLTATGGTADYFRKNNVPCEEVRKVHEGRPNCVDRIRSGQVSFVINTTSGRRSVEASFGIRRSCIDYSIPCITESDAALSFAVALRRARKKDFRVSPLPPLQSF